MIPFMYIIIVYLVFMSSIAKGLAMSQLGGVITTKKCYFVDLLAYLFNRRHLPLLPLASPNLRI